MEGVGCFSPTVFICPPYFKYESQVLSVKDSTLFWIHCYSPCFEPYDLTFVWYILILVLTDFSLDFHIFLNRLNNIRAYPFLSWMSSSDSPFTAQKYVNDDSLLLAVLAPYCCCFLCLFSFVVVAVLVVLSLLKVRWVFFADFSLIELVFLHLSQFLSVNETYGTYFLREL